MRKIDAPVVSRPASRSKYIQHKIYRMDWVQHAEEYIGTFGWGARGKHIGISRMFLDADKSLLSRHKAFANIRPRGILSGFLAVVPGLGYAVYIPPIASKVCPQRIRMRLSDEVVAAGAIFSAYFTREREFILEDVLVWKDRAVWNVDVFEERWNKYMGNFIKLHWRPDVDIQNLKMSLATYSSMDLLEQPGDNEVVEFIPNVANNKRLIWIPVKGNAPAIGSDNMSLIAKRDIGAGPDVFSIWRGEERLGVALVRTLAISKALRLHVGDTIPIKAQWNKTFDKWDIHSVGSANGLDIRS